MEFDLSPDQRLMVDSVARALDDAAPLDRIRRYAGDDPDDGADLWQLATELGLPGLVIAEDAGGSGLDLLDAAVVQQTLGARVAPLPFTSACVLAPLALGLADADAARAWLPRVAAGETRVGIAISEACGARENAGVDRTGGKLNGRALFVMDIEADAFIVADRSGGLHLVDGADTGLTRTALVTVDRTRRTGELRFDNAAAIALDAEADAITRLVDAGRVLLAADALGSAQYMLEAAVAYAGEREQFGRVIGSFQAVKHLCAEMAAALEPCQSLLWYAAHAWDHLPQESRLYACHAKAHISEVASRVAKTATEVHGGMGFTDLLGLHYWFKRIGLDRQLLGGPDRCREDAARLQGLVT